jgi:hypothetical protein
VPLSSMDVSSQLPGAPVLPIGAIVPSGDVEDSRIHIRNIEGLGPVKAEFQTTPFALARGVFFQGTSTGMRNITLTLGMAPMYSEGQTMAALRQEVYRYFMPEMGVRLTFVTSDLPDTSVHTDGVVESVEPNIFAQDPEMQISVLCHEPDFIGDEERIVGPFDVSDTITEVEYTGTISNGFNALEVFSPSFDYSGNVHITNEVGPYSMELDVDGIELSPTKHFKTITVPTRRRIQLVNDTTGVTSSLMANMTKGSSWPILYPGTNQLKIEVSDFILQGLLSYFNRYGGL